jgi:predicted dehydrogenase
MVAMKFRFNRDAIYIRKMIQAGEMGDMLYGFASYLKPLDIDYGKNNWRVKKAFSGGGTLIDNGIQVFDLIWWIMGCPEPVEVIGNTYIRTNASEVEDIANGMIRFENGATIIIESAWRSLIQDDTMTLRIFGTKGTANLWPFRVILEDGRELTSREMDHKGIVSENQFKHFIQCIENKHQPISTVEQSVTVMRIINAIYLSAKKKGLVNSFV